MNPHLPTEATAANLATPLPKAWPLAVVTALALLYLPVFAGLAGTLWQQQSDSHGPLILLAAGFLLWRQQPALQPLPAARQPLPGYLALTAGLLLLWFAQALQLPLLAMMSLPTVLAGTLLLLHGHIGLRLAALPLLLLLLAVPLPGWLIDNLTLPLKASLSLAAAWILQWLAYPVAHSGVIIIIGPYQMLVADACSGLHSLLSLSALGLLYIHLRGDKPHWHTACLVACLLPIALGVNLARTLLLILLTYHAGDRFARAAHDATGLLLFLLALMMLLGLGRLLDRISNQRST